MRLAERTLGVVPARLAPVAAWCLLRFRSLLLMVRREHFLAAYDLDPERLIGVVMARFGTNRAYTSHYVHQLVRHHRDNPLILLYLESELGALDRARGFLRAFAALFPDRDLFGGKRCLDVGANAGQTLQAFCERGAREAVGVEIERPRYETALLNFAGEDPALRSRLSMQHGDILDSGLVGRLGSFDVIFCLDVIEHVKDAEALVRQLSRLLSDAPGALLYLKVGNPYCPKNVLAEPHYRIPGLVLLPHELARRYYEAARSDPAMPYDVESWRSFVGYQALFQKEGLCCRPLREAHIAERDIDRFFAMAEPILPAFERFCEERSIPGELRREVEGFVRGYLADARDVCERYRATRDPKLDEHIWLTYFPVDSDLVVTRG